MIQSEKVVAAVIVVEDRVDDRPVVRIIGKEVAPKEDRTTGAGKTHL